MANKVENKPFPKTVKKSEWRNYLGRSLFPFEDEILHDLKKEIILNKKMSSLYGNCLTHNLYVPHLTKLDGNCFFECLVHGGIGTDIKSLRNAVAYMMWVFGDYKGFLPNREETLRDLFSFTNEIEYVFCKETEKLYKYTYDVMCMDLANEKSWGVLPTQLIQLLLSNVFLLNFKVVSDRFDVITQTHAFEAVEEDQRPVLTDFWIGHIFENHYVTAQKIPVGTEVEPLFYNDVKEVFAKWGSAMQKKRYERLLEEAGLESKKSEREEREKRQGLKHLNFSSDSFVHVGDANTPDQT